VGRNPQKCIHTTFFKADLLDPESVIKALNNTKIAYLTVGLPLDSEIWLRDWVIMQNVILPVKKQLQTRLF
jgi:hypothetical protein